MDLSQAVELLKNHGIVAFPTETVYGLGGRSDSEKAIQAIYSLKGRPAHNPLICHVSGISQASEIAQVTPFAKEVIEHFWPGPLTLVLPLKDETKVASSARAGLSTVALRCPNHPIAQRLITLVDHPLVAPSANLSNQISATRPEHVREHFPNLPVLEGGPCEGGVESTILDLSSESPRILRHGTLSFEDLITVLPTLEKGETISKKIIAPGMLKRHYAPRVPLRLNVNKPFPGESFLTFGPERKGDLNLSPSGNLKEAAHNLFHYLRLLEKKDSPIAVAPIPNEGIGKALNDRLKRAATPEKETSEEPS